MIISAKYHGLARTSGATFLWNQNNTFKWLWVLGGPLTPQYVSVRRKRRWKDIYRP